MGIMGVELNSNGVNKAIKYTILSDEEMKRIGFHNSFYENTINEQYSPCWWFSRRIEFPKEKEWKNTEIDLDVWIPKDGSDIDIMVLDATFCQTYDYQYILNKDPKQKCANIVKEQVEMWISYLQAEGVLSGHSYGDYI